MKMDKQSYGKLCCVAGSIETDIEVCIRNILEQKGEEFSGTIEEYFDIGKINSIDPKRYSALYDMYWAYNKIVDILINVEII